MDFITAVPGISYIKRLCMADYLSIIPIPCSVIKINFITGDNLWGRSSK